MVVSVGQCAGFGGEVAEVVIPYAHAAAVVVVWGRAWVVRWTGTRTGDWGWWVWGHRSRRGNRLGRGRMGVHAGRETDTRRPPAQ